MINMMKNMCLIVTIFDLCMFFTQGSITHLLLAGIMAICYGYWVWRGAA